MSRSLLYGSERPTAGSTPWNEVAMAVADRLSGFETAVATIM
jgi:hypothetical protein